MDWAWRAQLVPSALTHLPPTWGYTPPLLVWIRRWAMHNGNTIEKQNANTCRCLGSFRCGLKLDMNGCLNITQQGNREDIPHTADWTGLSTLECHCFGGNGGKHNHSDRKWLELGLLQPYLSSGVSEPDRHGASDSQHCDPDFAYCEKMETERKEWKNETQHEACNISHCLFPCALLRVNAYPRSFYSWRVWESIVARYVRPQSWKGMSLSTSVLHGDM